MRVAFITSDLSRSSGGLRSACEGLALEFAKREVFVCLYGARYYDSEESFPKSHMVDIEPLDVLGPKRLGCLWGLEKSLVKLKPDLVHLHGIWRLDAIQGAIWCLIHRVPFFVSPHGMLDAWAMRQRRSIKRIVLPIFRFLVLNRATGITVLTKQERSDVLDCGVSVDLHVIPNGVDLPSISHREGVKTHRAKVGMVRREHVLLYLGRLHPKKNIHEAIAAWKLLIEQQAEEGEFNWHFVIAGSGEASYERALREQVADYRLSSQVKFVGSLYGEAKRRAFEGADGFLLPSLSEGLPMSVLEAWSYGLPVLMTKECNLSEGVAAGAALHVGHDSSSISESLRKFFCLTESERLKMGANGRSLIEDRFTWQKAADETLSLYKAVLAKRDT